MYYNKIAKAFCLTLALFVLSGCDSNETDDPQDATGSFQLTITGATTETISGDQAGFGAASNPQTGISGFSLTIGGNTAGGQQLTFLRKGGRTEAGAYAVLSVDANTDFDALGAEEIFAIFSSGTDVFYSNGGTLSITESSSSRIEGTLNITAISLLDPNVGVYIIGSFTAVGLDIGG